jgi:hypothetical protein
MASFAPAWPDRLGECQIKLNLASDIAALAIGETFNLAYETGPLH